ncbi:hypothetical protein VTN77DRAFT_9256 [Rasamsonia byssochlamydoides]|uniref:uncharacterized protein n=1 Tax=Rasamsonia byssochlamydoides TaxID=89139 RepID=UPI0037448F8F
MPSELILLTGATGHIGFCTLVYALNAGYRVRAAVRNQDKADTIQAAPSIQAIKPDDRLSFVFVPDILAPGAFDDAVRDVDYIIHVASPLSRGTDPARYEDLIQPAVKGTLGILSAAAKHGGNHVKRVVITSPMAALFPLGDHSSDTVFNETSRVSPDPGGPYSTAMEAYAASKIIALNATERFVQEHQPAFDIVNIHPSFVIGKNELVTDKKDISRARMCGLSPRFWARRSLRR